MANEIQGQLARLDEVSKDAQKMGSDLACSFSGAYSRSMILQKAKAAMTEDVIRQVFMPLMNINSGWRADKNDYSIDVIRDAWLDACINGASPINNEMNIISARPYYTKNFFIRKLREYPGLTDLVIQPGKVTTMPTGALVEYKASWKLNGKEMSLERLGNSAIPVRLNNGMGVDGALGKGDRKIRAAIFAMITGSEHSDGDVEDGFGRTIETGVVSATVVQPTRTEEVKAAIKAKSTAKPTDQAPWDVGDAAVAETKAAPEAKAEAKPEVKAETKAEPEKPKATPGQKKVGHVRNGATGDFTPVFEKEKEKEAKAESVDTSTGEIQPEVINASISAITRTAVGTDPKSGEKTYRYKVVDANSVAYYSMELSIAQKSKELQTAGKTAEISYHLNEKKENMILSINEAPPKGAEGDAGQESNEFGVDADMTVPE